MIEHLKKIISKETDLPADKIKIKKVGNGPETYLSDGTKTLYERDRHLDCFERRLKGLKESNGDKELILSVANFVKELKTTDKEEVFYYWSYEDSDSHWGGWAIQSKLLWSHKTKKEKA